MKTIKIVALLYIALFSFSARAQYACTNQLETQLEEMPSWYLEWVEPEEQDVPLACVHRAMGVFMEWTTQVKIDRAEDGKREIGHYVYCRADGSKAIRKHEPPCPSDNYLSTVANSYNTVLKCLDFAPKDLFAITAVESGFQINTLSLSGQDIGIGQLTPVAVEDVNPHWDKYTQMILQSDNPHCQNLKPIVEGMVRTTKNLTCNLTNLSDNPVRNLIYVSYLHFKNREYMKTFFDNSSLPIRVENLIGRALSFDEKERLKEVLIALSYNAGSPGAAQAFDKYLLHREAPTKEAKESLRELKRKLVNLYLLAQSLYASGKDGEAQATLNQRSSLESDYMQLVQEKSSSNIDINEFGINDLPNSFGKFLVSKDLSHYLNILQGRIKYVEESIDRVGGCGTQNYLEKISQ